MNKKVTFASKTWEGDWQKMAAGGWKRKLESIPYPFSDTLLIINNGVPHPEALNQLARRTYIAENHAGDVLEFFKLKKEDFDGGYNYSIAELTALYYCETEYLCYLQGDCITSPSCDWVTKGIEILESRPEVAVVSPASQVNTWHGIDGTDFYMSDQAFLVRTEEFRSAIPYQASLLEPHDSDYPDYGKNSFEHMIGVWLKQTERKRKILEDVWVSHPAI